jgi:hypothetical protein
MSKKLCYILAKRQNCKGLFSDLTPPAPLLKERGWRGEVLFPRAVFLDDLVSLRD